MDKTFQVGDIVRVLYDDQVSNYIKKGYTYAVKNISDDGVHVELVGVYGSFYNWRFELVEVEAEEEITFFNGDIVELVNDIHLLGTAIGDQFTIERQVGEQVFLEELPSMAFHNSHFQLVKNEEDNDPTTDVIYEDITDEELAQEDLSNDPYPYYPVSLVDELKQAVLDGDLVSPAFLLKEYFGITVSETTSYLFSDEV